jgi:phage terminase small subunit
MGNKSGDDYLKRLAELEGEGEHDGLEELAESDQTAVTPIVTKARKWTKRELTKSQLAFANELIKGNTLKASYRIAYPNSQCNDACAVSNASKLARDPRISKMVNEGNEEHIEHLSESVEGMRRFVLKEFLALSKDARQEGSRLKALELLARSIGMFKETDSTKDKTQTPDQLKRELTAHLKLLNNVRPLKRDGSTGLDASAV